MVASELARGRGKSNAIPLLSAALLVSLVGGSGGLWAAPQGGEVVGGSGSIGASGSTTTITQTSDKLSINWQSFNVAKSETVNFVQPSASALAVNRILDTQGSQILGKVNANGQVWLINPNGVIFGKDAQINVGALVASTLNPDDASIGSARSNFSGSSTAGVVNLGSINAAQGGYVALLGHSVSNQGSISAPGGTVALGAGSAVSLNFAGSKLLGLEVTSNQVNALAENGGLIQADGGQVLLSAGARDSLLASVVNNTGVIQARTVQEQEGKIILLGGMAAGTTNVGGTLDASAPNGGNGGFIETSASHVNVAEGAVVTTQAVNGQTGKWLIDPNDFTVAASGGNMTAKTITDNLDKTNFEIATATMGSSGGEGDIVLSQDLSWTSSYTLTLTAQRDIALNGFINAANGGLTLSASRNISAPKAVSVGTFMLTNGNWSQLGSSLPSFSATDFRLTGGTFIRALGGDGSSHSPYQITDVYGLQGIGSTGMLGYEYTVANDIVASGTSAWDGGSGFAPIGASASSIFTGTFDGQGHTITGLTINRSSTDYVALFGYVGKVGVVKVGVVKNVGLLGGAVTGNGFVGNLVGYNYFGTISNSYATGNASGQRQVGGLVGSNYGGDISESYATGSVTNRGNITGGLVGINRGTISNSYATGQVTGINNVGGLVGQNMTVPGSETLFKGSISNSYATGSVTGSIRVGGFVGNNSGAINASYFDTESTGKSSAFGVNTGTLTVTSLTSANMKKSSNFANWDISSDSSISKTWFMYEDHSNPLLRAFLTPLTVTVKATGKKTYDGNTKCRAISCEVVYSLTPTKTLNKESLSFELSSKDAGTVSVSASGLYSDQQGYLISYATGTATIDKKALTYTANKANFNTGNPLAALSGAVSGFVNNETQYDVTTGTLTWTTPATSTSAAGSYGIYGSGLRADNYTFTQAAGNDRALTLTTATSLVPVVRAAPLPSNNRKVNTLPNASNDINKLAATGAGSEERDDELSAEVDGERNIQPIGSTGLVFAALRSVNLPNAHRQSIPAGKARESQ